MSYPKQLLRLQPQRGFISDTADHEAGPEFWTQCSNVQFRDGFATRLQGYRNAYSTELGDLNPIQLFHALNSSLSTLNWWILAEADGSVWAIQAGTSLNIDGGLFISVASPEEYNSALINGIPLLNNGKNEPVYWPGTGDMLTLPDWTPSESAKFIAVLKFHVFAFNISGPGGSFESLVKWSSATEPGTVPASWTPAQDNDAGSVELADSPGPILCAYPLGDTLYIYKRSSTYQARYVGGNTVFSFRKVQSSSGALSSRAVADIGGAHLIVTDGDIILNDGTTRRSIGESRVKEFFFDQLDPDFYPQVQATYNRAKDEVIIGFPSTGSTFLDRALVYDLSRDSFGFRELNQVTHLPIGLVSDTIPANTWENRTEVWADAQAVWAKGFGSGASDSLIALEQTNFVQQDSEAATVVPALIGRSGLSFGEPERIKFVRRLHIRTRSPFQSLFVKVGGQMEANGSTTWSPEVELSGAEQIVNAFAQGRFISVEVRSNDSTVWKLTGIDIEAEMRGYH